VRLVKACLALREERPADLTAWTTLAQKSAPQTHQQVTRTLTHWRQDADLAGVRELDALSRLPTAEADA
jgi:hypothetical protein